MARVRVKVTPEPPEEKAGQSVNVQSEEPTPIADQQSAVPEPIPSQPQLPQNPAPEAIHSSPNGLVISKQALVFGLIGAGVLILLIFAISNRESAKGPQQESKQFAQSTQPAANSAENEAKKYQDELSKIVDLPSDKTPTYSVVNDADKLAKSSPVIFKNAKNGDVFLVYLNDDKTAKVVLYRPSAKKIIVFIDGVNLGSNTQGTSNKPTIQQ